MGYLTNLASAYTPVESRSCCSVLAIEGVGPGKTTSSSLLTPSIRYSCADTLLNG